MTRRPHNACGGFTLIEILLAAVAAALVLAAVYGIFQQAVRIRDGATQRTRDSRVRLRAEKIIRADLSNAFVSGGLLANVCEGDSASVDHNISNAGNGATHSAPSNIPGYFRFTTTTGRNDAATGLNGDVQQVEYYIAQDPKAADQNAAGVLIRAVTRDLLDTSGLGGSSASSASSSPSPSGANTNANTSGTGSETAVLAGVQSFQVSFYDGANWQASWQFSDLSTRISPAANVASSTTGATAQVVTGQTSLPDAVRIDIQQAPASPGGPTPPPLEILVPWSTQPFVAATPANAGSAQQ